MADPKSLEKFDFIEEPAEPVIKPLRFNTPEEDAAIAAAQAPVNETIKDFAAGAGQGASFGFGDELAAGVASILPKSKTYEENLQDYRKLLAEAKQRSPFAYGTGEIGGAVATSFLPGMAALGPVKGAGALENIARAGLQGSTLGVLGGAGYSEAPDLAGTLDDATKGAGTGALLGGGFGIGNEALKKGAEVAGRTQTVEDLLRAYQLAKQGKDITSGATRTGLVQEEIKAANNLVKTLESSRSQAGKQMAEAAKAAKAKGVAFGTEDILEKADEILNTPGISDGEKKSLESSLNKFLYKETPKDVRVKQVSGPKGTKTTISSKQGNIGQLPEDISQLLNPKEVAPSISFKNSGDMMIPEATTSATTQGTMPGMPNEQLDPEQLSALLKEVGALQGTYSRRAGGPSAFPSDKELSNKLSNLFGTLKDKTKTSMPEYAAASSKYSDIANSLDDLGGFSPDKRAPDLMKAEPEALNFTQNMGELTPQQIQKEQLIGKGLEQGIGGPKTSELFQGLRESSQNANLARKMGSEIQELAPSVGGLPKPTAGFIKRGLLTGAAKTGGAVKGFQEGLQSAIDSPNNLTRMAGKVSQSLGDMLKHASEQNPTQRAATMFMIKSDPVYREELKNLEESGAEPSNDDFDFQEE